MFYVYYEEKQNRLATSCQSSFMFPKVKNNFFLANYTNIQEYLTENSAPQGKIRNLVFQMS